MKEGKIIIIMPVYNEGIFLENQIKSILEYFMEFSKNFYLIIVNDGSTDSTKEILKKYETQRNIILKHHPTNKGLGKALLTGLTEVKNLLKEEDIIVTMESDSTNELSCLTKIEYFLQRNWDIVICSRLHPQGRLIGFPFYRRITTVIVNKLLKFCFPYDGIKDYSMIYRGYKGELIKKLFTYYGNTPLKFSGFASTSELLLRLLFLTPNLKIKEIPTVYRYDLKCSKSKMHIVKTIIEYIALIIYFHKYKYKYERLRCDS